MYHFCKIFESLIKSIIHGDRLEKSFYLYEPQENGLMSHLIKHIILIHLLLWNPNRITVFFNDNKKMKCPFILILTGLNVGPLAATTFEISRIYSNPKYAQC